MEPKNIEQLFGTLQQSILDVWRFHLDTGKHSVHKILDDYYKEMPELIDNLIEHYFGIFSKVTYETVKLNTECAVTYFSELREFVKGARYLLKGETELESDLDEILGFIDSTLYKMKQMTGSEEHYCLSDYLIDKVKYNSNCQNIGIPSYEEDC